MTSHDVCGGMNKFPPGARGWVLRSPGEWCFLTQWLGITITEYKGDSEFERDSEYEGDSEFERVSEYEGDSAYDGDNEYEGNSMMVIVGDGEYEGDSEYESDSTRVIVSTREIGRVEKRRFDVTHQVFSTSPYFREEVPWSKATLKLRPESQLPFVRPLASAS
uniref:Uncharacterized protein n=1 Tax=Timema douglasi TaxID=61478 RepID=A0A7R8VEM2_TIMDO|nr:unnamed protein product [Timema douglasi]